MNISMVAPELRAAARRMPTIPFDRKWIRSLIRGMSGMAPAVKVPGVAVEEVSEAGNAGVRIHRPDIVASDAVLLWIHGGGLVIGRAVQDDRVCANAAKELGIVVVSVDYRLAPEHPFPAAIDDCLSAWEWLQRSAAALDVDPARVVIGGQSAGGGLAANLVQRLHDAGGPRPIAQWLFCPMLDDRTAARAELDSVGHRVWNNRLNRFGWQSYLGVAPGSPDIPPYAVAARREDLSGLPPAWICVGDIDVFHDEDQDYAERLRAAGVDATFHVVPGAPHGFESWAAGTGPAQALFSAAHDWLRQEISER